ncbi:class I SAM-dependent methyltransferase [Mycobacterium spongiae]|uniref:N-6 DNA methylase n=1 Tax=Mycobacterium spongiae TaxID=886343 RepID=A0A975K0S5_9MYCO|nr:class I SAM-dependent methyltransferase [Mycobacterium spongiae]QUR68943.1 N-6 DNA methylase [Mycobacterium spongiae]
MAKFTAKAAPGGDKLRGGYYTPDPIARFIAGWVGVGGGRVLEPSCGDGAILRHLVTVANPQKITAVELVAGEAKKATVETGVRVVVGDFFSWFEDSCHGTFDAVAGNPPYIRFGSWEPMAREPALALMRAQGMHPTRLTNAWVPFVVASVLAVRPGGRIGLVLPAELLQVGYAAALRSYLIDECASITIVSFKELVFPGILQEVVLLLAERGRGPAGIRTVELPNSDQLNGFDGTTPASVARAHLHESEKWTKYYLPSSAIRLIRRVRASGRLHPLSRYAGVDVGVVTGRNSFFCMSSAEARQRGLIKMTMPLLSRSAQAPGLSFTAQDLAMQNSANAPNRLLTIPSGIDLRRNKMLAAYLAEGELDGVPNGYKCSIRRRWWEVPSTWVPDGFMLRQISTHPRLVANLAGATSTDTVHRVRLAEDVDIERLAAGAFNSATFALAEVLGRSYGGGILELEPSECGHLPVPNPALVPPTLHQKVDELLRERRIDDALNLVDEEVLIERLGFDGDDVAGLRRAWIALRDRRRGRSKRTRPI